MSSNTSLITDALEYYDKNMDKYSSFIKKCKYIKFLPNDKDIEHTKVILYDKDNNQLLESRYEILGTYVPINNVWVWGWAIPTLYKNRTFIVRKILNYGIELDPNEKFLKSELITSRFRVSSSIQLDMHASIASYLSKKPLIMRQIEIPDQMTEEGQQIPLNLDVDKSKWSIVYYFFLLDYDKIKIE